MSKGRNYIGTIFNVEDPELWTKNLYNQIEPEYLVA